MNGVNPDLYALHSLRSGGATALYRATGDLDLVDRYGRWKSSSIHGYLREPHQMLLGVAELMTSEGGPIIHSAAGRRNQKLTFRRVGGVLNRNALRTRAYSNVSQTFHGNPNG